MKNIVLLALTCTMLSEVRAQISSSVSTNDTLRTYALPEIVVTATRTEKNPNEVGRSITLVSSEQIRNAMFLSIGEVLSQHEGLYLVGVGQNFGANQSIFMRGAASNQTAIMVDDVRISDPSSVNNALDISELSTAGIDRVEIVRGSHSTLYGSSAIGGVVNLITRKNWTPGFHVDAELRTGMFGKATSLFGQNLFLNYTDASGFYLNGGALNTRVRGLDATIDTVTNPTVFKHRDQDGLNTYDLMGKIGFRNEKFDGYLSFKNHSEKKDIDKAVYVDDDNYTLDFRRNLLTYGASYTIDYRWNLKFLGGYSEMKRVAVDDSSIVDNAGNTDHTYADNQWKGTTGTNELQTSLRLPAFEALVGVGFYKETMSAKSCFYSNSIFGPFEFKTNLDTLGLNTTTKNLFAQLDLNGYLLSPAFDRFNLAVGARLNQHSSFGSHATYEVNPSFRVMEGILVYASYSTGFNAPSLYQLFAPDRDFTSGITRGSSSLKPEESRSFEIGWKYSSSSDVHFTLSYFNTIVENSIEYVYLWEKNVSIEQLGTDFRRNDFRGDTYLNVGQQTTYGVEFTVNARISDQLTFAGNLSSVSGKLVYKPDDIDETQTQGHHVQIYSNGGFIIKEVESTDLVRRPNTLNVSVTYRPIPIWTLRLDVKHAGSRFDIFYDSKRGPYGALGTVPVKEYTSVELSQHLRVYDRLSLNARIENIFNATYQEINGFTTRGRGLYVSLRYEFDQQK